MKWEENVRKVVPYVAGEQPDRADMIKLNTNECPYPPAPGVRKLMDEMDVNRLRLYPNPEVKPLVSELAKHYGVDTERVFVGVGSDDVLSMSFLTFFNSGKEILFPEITYSFYDVWANLYRIPYRQIPLNADWSINPEDYKCENGGIVIANPNAPTGICEPLSKIEEIVAANPDVIVIVDEAYVDFGGETALPLTEKYDNLLVVQTFSKSRSMAGLRIGFAIGSAKLIKYLNDAKFSFNSYTVNMPAQLLGVEAVADNDYFISVTDRIIKTREWTKAQLKDLGFEFPDSKTNFIFAKHPSFSGDYIYNKLRERNIFVRHWNAPLIADYLRITIGTDLEMQTVIDCLKDILKES